jgi:hypothetical protein
MFGDVLIPVHPRLFDLQACFFGPGANLVVAGLSALIGV